VIEEDLRELRPGEVRFTLDALAQAAGLPKDALTSTVARYNGMVREGVDKDFAAGGSKGDRDAALLRRRSTARAEEHGRHRIDTDSRVLDKDQKPIAGFLAAGEVTGFGASTEGGARGRSRPSIVTGRVAGRTILEIAVAISPRVPISLPPPSAEVKIRERNLRDLPRSEDADCVVTGRLLPFREGAPRRDRRSSPAAPVTRNVPNRPDRHRIDALRQIDTCKNCHVATER
jgi:hypothetical protein